MKLFYRIAGEGDPIVIAHGLYGSSDNWMSISKILAKKHQVILVDLRNHGQSPHSASHTYSDLSDDLFELFNKLNLTGATLIGHSMGGKAAMQFAINHSEKLKSLIVVDIPPKSYADSNGYSPQAKDHLNILSAMREMPLEALATRAEAEATLATRIPSAILRQFLLKNLDRDDNGKFVWKINLDALWQKLPALMGGVKTPDNFIPIRNLEVLAIKGENSPYIDETTDKLLFTQLFPNTKIVTIKGAGHWVHAEQPTQFIEAVENFLSL